MEALKQPQFSPLPMEEQAAVLFLAVNGYLMDVKTENVSSFVKDYLLYLKSQKADILKSIAETGVISDAQEGELRNAAEAYKKQHKQG